jgi:ribosome-associated translation inhibitor RaiA
MRPLTHRVWEQHFTQLRPYILEEWPDVDRQELEAVGDDWDGLVSLIQDATGMSADLVGMQLKKLDVDELGLGTGEREPEEDSNRATVRNLRFEEGFTEAERERVIARLQKLDRRLRKFPADGTDLVISVKDRDSNSQKVTLECSLPHFARIIATSAEPDLRAAIMEVREDLWRQIDDAVNKRKEVLR